MEEEADEDAEALREALTQNIDDIIFAATDCSLLRSQSTRRDVAPGDMREVLDSLLKAIVPVCMNIIMPYRTRLEAVSKALGGARAEGKCKAEILINSAREAPAALPEPKAEFIINSAPKPARRASKGRKATWAERINAALNERPMTTAELRVRFGLAQGDTKMNAALRPLKIAGVITEINGAWHLNGGMSK